MKKKAAAVIALGLGLCLMGCQGNNNTTPVSTNGDAEATPTAQTAMQATPTDVATEVPVDTASAEPQEEVVQNKNQENSGKRTLSQHELEEFSEELSDEENYGFLLSVYNQPKDVDLLQVFYNGADIDEEDVIVDSEQEREDYMKEVNAEDLMGDLLKLPKKEVDEILLEKLGMTLSEMNTDMSDFVYLEKYNAYYIEHGDSNYTSFTCTEGYEENGNYVINYKKNESTDNSSYQVTLKRTGDDEDDFEFVSNQKLENVNK